MLKILSIPIIFSVVLVFSLNKLFPLPIAVEFSTTIIDNKGEMIHAFLTSDDKWRFKATLSEISPLLRRTIIEKEDRYFYSHAGVNPLAIMRAAFNNVLHMKRTSGASTITMQVSRAIEPGPRTYTNKIVEIFRAFQLEWKYTKDEILLLYCNLLPYGGNIEGIKSAARLYLDKDPNHLSLAEITALSVIPNRPASLIPGRNNGEIIKERNRWLKIFASRGFFTDKQIADALEEPFIANRKTVPREIPHLARRLAESGDVIIPSSIDMNVQRKTEILVEDHVRSLRLNNIYNAAVVIVDNKTNQVITYVGSSNFHDSAHAGQVDGASAVRQPGSTLKPLLFGMCIDEGLLTPKTMIADVPLSYQGYSPENFDRKFNGFVTMEYALEHSLNIPAVKSLRQLGTDKFISALARHGFRQIRRDNRKLGLSMILGGCGATLFELTALYSAFANDGVYVKPRFRTDDQSGSTDHLLSPGASFMIRDILSRAGRPDFPLNWQSTKNMPRIAWKTGTSYGRRDAWSIGFNKRFTVGVWTGNFSGKGAAALTGADIATPLLFKIFNTIDYDGDEAWFSQPPDCSTRLVCTETGLSPAEHCDRVVSDYFLPMVSPASICNNVQEIIVSPDERVSYCRMCMPETGYRKKLYKKVPAEMQAYYDERRLLYQKIPLHNIHCEKIFTDQQPLILSPLANTDYLISRSNPEPLQLRCRAGNDVSKVFWYVNDRYFKTSEAASSQFFIPEEGPVKISCTDDKGRNRDLWINVKYVDL